MQSRKQEGKKPKEGRKRWGEGATEEKGGLIEGTGPGLPHI